MPTSGATTQRSSYYLGGQLMSIRVKTGSSSAIRYYVYTDHLGNVSVLGNDSVFVSGSLARYEPFGGFRTEPTSNPAITDRGFTGHKHNNTGTYDVGLVYMNARYYLPEIGRFISADTTIPDPQNPRPYFMLDSFHPTSARIQRGSLDLEYVLNPGGGTDADYNVHHWAWAFAIGYNWGEDAILINTGRELTQIENNNGNLAVNYSDIALGNAGAVMGILFASNYYGYADITTRFVSNWRLRRRRSSSWSSYLSKIAATLIGRPVGTKVGQGARACGGKVTVRQGDKQEIKGILWKSILRRISSNDIGRERVVIVRLHWVGL